MSRVRDASAIVAAEIVDTRPDATGADVRDLLAQALGLPADAAQIDDTIDRAIELELLELEPTARGLSYRTSSTAIAAERARQAAALERRRAHEAAQRVVGVLAMTPRRETTA